MSRSRPSGRNKPCLSWRTAAVNVAFEELEGKLKAEDKKMAEAVVRRLCQGAQIDGIRFGPIPQILITDHSSGKPRIKGQVYLNLGSSWTVFHQRPLKYPDCEEELPKIGTDEELQTLCSLREAIISDVELGEEQPHLIFHLENGISVFFNGRDDRYECWQLGVAFGNPEDLWQVVALMDGEVAVWFPDSFDY